MILILVSELFFGLFYELIGSEYFCDGPGLGEGSSADEGRIAVKDFAEGADAAAGEVVGQRGEKLAGDRRFFVHFEVGLDEGANEPTPGSALVVAAVSFGAIAAVGAGVAGVGLSERSQPVRGQQLLRAGIDDGLLLLLLKRWGVGE